MCPCSVPSHASCRYERRRETGGGGFAGESAYTGSSMGRDSCFLFFLFVPSSRADWLAAAGQKKEGRRGMINKGRNRYNNDRLVQDSTCVSCIACKQHLAACLRTLVGILVRDVCTLHT